MLLFFSLFAPSMLLGNNIASAQSQDQQFKTIPLLVDNETYEVNYRFANGGTITDISANTDLTKVSLNMTTNSDGNLELVFPRALADVTYFSISDSLALIAKGSIVSNVAIPLLNSCEQTSFLVPVKSDYQHIELIGAVPLYGSGKFPVPSTILATKVVEAAGKNFTIVINTNAVKCDVTFVQQEKKIHIVIEGKPEGNYTSGGFLTIQIPREMLDGNYSVLVEGKSANFTDGASRLGTRSLLINYEKNDTAIDIIGTMAIPEFASPMVLLIIGCLGGILILRHCARINFRTRLAHKHDP